MGFGATPQLLSTFYFINFLLSNSINDEQKIFNPDDIAKYPNCQNGDLAKVAKQFSPSEESEGQKEVLPTFPETIYPLLPDFLRQITNYANSGEDADLLLLSSLVVTSACLPNVYGIYGGVTVFPNLFLFVTVQAPAGRIQRLFRWHTEAIRRPLRARYCRFCSPFRVDNLSHSHDFNHLANL